jgi:hypothetical protein
MCRRHLYPTELHSADRFTIGAALVASAAAGEKREWRVKSGFSDCSILPAYTAAIPT